MSQKEILRKKPLTFLLLRLILNNLIICINNRDCVNIIKSHVAKKFTLFTINLHLKKSFLCFSTL